MSQGTAAQAEQPCVYDWTSGQQAQAMAQFVIALGSTLLRFEPAKLLPLLLKHGAKLVEKLGEAIAAFIIDTDLTILPLFADSLGKGWRVIEDGAPVDEDGSWVEEFFAKITLACVHTDGKECLTSKELVKRIRARMNGRREFDQHVLDWLFRHWSDPRIPIWFKEAVEEGIVVVTTGSNILDPVGYRFVLCLYWLSGRLQWRSLWVGSVLLKRSCRGLVPSDS